MKIDLVYFSKEATTVNWQHGIVHVMPLYISTTERINQIAQTSSAEWLFFWDSSLGKPNESLILELTESNIDVWHAGLKLGVAGLPDAINYIDPTWIYNKDATDDVISSSFRLSIRACLIKTKTLNAVGGCPKEYWTVDMMSIALGYLIIKQGGIMRYHPQLVNKKEQPHAMPIRDEWAFARKFFPKKWQLWILFNKPRFKLNYKYWRSTAQVKNISLLPSLHNSDEIINTDKKQTVSVLAPTLDRYPYLAKELEQLNEQTILPQEVLVTDQTDAEHRQVVDVTPYQSLVIKYYPQIEKGQCVAWNKLLEVATGDYVLFLGDDADNIKPGFIEKLLATAQYYGADMVASNVIELKAPKRTINHHYYMADTFPITLIKRKLVLDAGMMDMFFNKNIRADYDLSIRCHLSGALMIFDSSALIDHHRAPSGGLRTYKARAITNSISKNSLSKFAEPTSSELYLIKKHFNAQQFKMFVRIKYFDQLIIKGNVLKKLARLIIFLFKVPSFRSKYKQRLAEANTALKQNDLLRY